MEERRAREGDATQPAGAARERAGAGDGPAASPQADSRAHEHGSAPGRPTWSPPLKWLPVHEHREYAPDGSLVAFSLSGGGVQEEVLELASGEIVARTFAASPRGLERLEWEADQLVQKREAEGRRLEALANAAAQKAAERVAARGVKPEAASARSARGPAKERPPLSPAARLVLRVLLDLPTAEPISAKEIGRKLEPKSAATRDTLTKAVRDRLVPELKKKGYGVRSKRGEGYWLPMGARAAARQSLTAPTTDK